MLIKTAGQTLTEQLASHFAERIRSRLLAAGARLPSVRQCAQQQQVSASTVVAAYDRLLALGLVEARKNRGFYVREFIQNKATAHGIYAQTAIYSIANSARRPIDATALMRGMFQGDSDTPQPGMGVLPPDWLANNFMPAAVRRVAAGSADFSRRYGDPAGDLGLRQSLSKKLLGLHIPAAPEQIITTVGATHALDIASRTLLRPGDCVMVEEPRLGGGIRPARSHGHAHPAGAAQCRRAGLGGDGTLLRGA